MTVISHFDFRLIKSRIEILSISNDIKIRLPPHEVGSRYRAGLDSQFGMEMVEQVFRPLESRVQRAGKCVIAEEVTVVF